MTKVAALEGAKLDYWVAHALCAWEWGHQLYPTMTLDSTFSGVEIGDWPLGEYGSMMPAAILIPNNPFRQDRKPFCPSSEWQHGGPIIARERISIYAQMDEGKLLHWVGVDEKSQSSRRGFVGGTPLEAAMRTIVATRYGDDIPVR